MCSQRLRARKEWKFFAVLPQAAPGLAAAWWTVLLLRGILPAAFAIAMGVLVGAVQHGHSLAGPLTFAGAIFVLLQVLSPIHQALSANLGDRTAAWLYDRLTEACVRPPGIGHLEDPTLTSDLTVARDFDLGMTGPPLSISMDFIASGMVEMVGGLASAVILVRYAWWAPLLLAGAWLATHWLLRESGVWHDRQNPEVRAAQRDADYAYRLAVDPPASKELRLFGLAGWTIDRFVARRTRLHELQYAATRLRERPVLWSLLLVVSANVIVFWMLAFSVAHGRISPGRSRGLRAKRDRRVDDRLRRPQLGARRIGCPGGRGAAPGTGHASRRRSAPLAIAAPMQVPAKEIRLRDVTFAYPAANDASACSRARALRSDHPRRNVPGHRGPERRRQNHHRQAAVPLVRSAIGRHHHRRRRPAGVRSRLLALAGHRRVPGLYPPGAAAARKRGPGRSARRGGRGRARPPPGAANLASLDTILARGYTGGTDLSGGQWQRVALARALAAVSLGAGVVLLDEPTAQLDVRGEAEIFDRLLAATRHCTTILISHRFSTVRHADRICVLEQGRVIELGTHDELMALGGRYRTMFDLQAQRFHLPEQEGVTYDALT